MQKDPVVERVRKIKREIAGNFGYDIHKFAEYIKERQKKIRCQAGKYYKGGKGTNYRMRERVNEWVGYENTQRFGCLERIH